MLPCASNPLPYPGDHDALDEVMPQGDEKHPARGIEVLAFDIRVEHRFLDVIAAFACIQPIGRQTIHFVTCRS